MPHFDPLPAERVPLHRLIKRREAETLLKQFAALMPNNDLAIIRDNGQFFAGTGDWSQTTLEALLAQTNDGQIVRSADCVLYPLQAGSQLVGALVAYGQAAEAVLNSLQHSLTIILTQAIEKRDLARETLERYHEINLLYHIGETIGACLDSQEIPGMLLSETNRVIETDASIVMLAEEDDDARQVEIKVGSGTSEHIEALQEVSQQLIAQAYSTGHSDIIVSEAVDTGPFGTILYAPLKTQEQMLGVILLARLKGEPMFTAGDKKLVLALTSQATIAIEKAWLHQQEIKRQRLEEELSIGRRIQLSLLPAACPSIPGWEFAAIYQAARQVGGDLYDFFELQGKSPRLGLVIADVTGKGVPAALFMAVSRTTIRTSAMTGHNPAAVLEQANQLIIQNSRSRLFLSAFYATLNTASGQLVYANGGHDWPLWLQADKGECQNLTARGTILGAFKDILLEERTIKVAPGDILIFYTDGITEARNAERELFGELRLQEILAANPAAGAEQMGQAILDAVQTFVGDTPQSDDFTLFVIKRQKTTS